MANNRITITLPSDDRWLPFANESLHQYGQMVGFSERLEEMLASPVMEACEELFRKAAQMAVHDTVNLGLDFKGEAVVVDIEYNARIPLNPHETEDYEVPEADTDLEDLEIDTLWLHMIKRRMDRVHFMVRGSRHVLRMIKYRRDEGKEKQAWVMAIKPELQKELILHLDDQDAEHPSSVLQNPGGGVLKLGPSETFIIQHIDGKTSFHDIYMAHIDALGLTSPDMLARLFEKLESMKMLADPEEELKKARIRKIITKIINPNISIPRADDVVTAVYSKTKFFYTHFGLWLLLAIGLSGIFPYWEHLSRFRVIIAGLEDRFFNQPLFIIPVYILILFHVTLHELGHGVTCKHYGGNVPRLGIMFYLASFIFYCDTTAAWNFPKKRHRILVSLGGPIMSFAIFGLGLWAAGYYAGTDSMWESVFVTFSLINLFVLMMNFNPFIRMDAYYMLVDYTGIPNLREKSFRFLKRKTFGWLGFGSEKDTKVTIRERRIFWWYGILGALMTVFFLAIPILRLRYLLRAESLFGGKLFIALLIVVLLVARLASIAFSMVRSIRYREYKIQ
ncbi:hypothetical protein ACFL4N_02665 [Thermodesulfobacteriota bacterium]